VPELPEVEIASRQLRGWAQGRRIERASAARSRVIRGQAPARFAQLAGRRLEQIVRLGKWMLLSFDGGEGLVSHLGMTGKWMRRRKADAPPSQVRATLELEDGHAIDYRDPRLFGRLVRGTVEQLRSLPALAALGPDPLGGIDVQRLHRVLRGTRRSLKEALMDQRTLAGLGNIQVSEGLHRAGLHPARPSNRLRLDEVDALAKAIGAALRAALDAEDSPEPITYVEEGGPNSFLVYDRKGQPCTTCGTPIQRIVQGGRSTFFCPTCQPRSGKRADKAGAPRASHAAKPRPLVRRRAAKSR
jgi:formamidopyrimidine-DNA glycosylase